jgi:hypothetical protein
MIADYLTIKTPGEVADKAADPPAAIDKIPLFSDFLTRPELHQRFQVHIVAVRRKDPQDSNAGLYATGYFGYKSLIYHVHPKTKVTVDTYGAKTGSTDYFPIGKHAFLVSTLKILSYALPATLNMSHIFLARLFVFTFTNTDAGFTNSLVIETPPLSGTPEPW